MAGICQTEPAQRTPKLSAGSPRLLPAGPEGLSQPAGITSAAAAAAICHPHPLLKAKRVCDAAGTGNAS